MKRALITLAVGDTVKEMTDMSHPTMKAYAQKHGLEFVVLDKPPPSDLTPPHWSKLNLYDLFDQYEAILYMDADVLVRAGCPEIIELSEGKFMALNEYPVSFHRQYLEYWLGIYRSTFSTKPFEWADYSMNAGVMVLWQKHKEMFRWPTLDTPQKTSVASRLDSCFEQYYLVIKLLEEKFEFKDLPWQFNCMPLWLHRSEQEQDEAYVLHYAGAFTVNQKAERMRLRLKKWKQTATIAQCSTSYASPATPAPIPLA